jgi:hypothetical protein
MTARARHRGHRIEWAGHKWVFTDWSAPTMGRYGKERPCTACGKRSRERAPDFCLGKLPHVRQACCGHGHPEDAFFIFDNGVEVRGADAVRLQECWIHTCLSQSEVIEAYLLVLDVEVVYRLCLLGNMGLLRTHELVAIAETFRRNSLDIVPFCDILEIYSKRNPRSAIRFWRHTWD